MNRDAITQWIAEHGFTVTDDGQNWHILVPLSDGSAETFTASTYKQARVILGY